MAYADSSIQASVARFADATITDNTYKSKASTAYVKGQLVRITTSGTVEPITAGAATGIHGIIMETVAAAASRFVSVLRLNKDVVLEMQLHHAAGASAVPAQAQIGNQYEVKIVSGITGVDLEETTSPDVEVTDIYPNWADGTADGNGEGEFGLVRVKIVPSKIDTAPGEAT